MPRQGGKKPQSEHHVSQTETIVLKGTGHKGSAGAGASAGTTATLSAGEPDPQIQEYDHSPKVRRAAQQAYFASSKQESYDEMASTRVNNHSDGSVGSLDSDSSRRQQPASSKFHTYFFFVNE